MSNDILADYSLNPNSISAFTGVNVSEGMQRSLVNNAMRQFASTAKANFAANAGTITSASTLTLASISTGDYILLTPSGGSSSITSFGTATEGLSKRLEALGTVILRNDSAKLNLPSGSDLTISTGDVIYARALSGTAWKILHMPYNGIPQSMVNATSATASDTSKVLILSGGSVQVADASAVGSLGNTSGGYISLAGGHTISAGNNEAVLDFISASAVTCSFVPLASLSAGFRVTVINSSAQGYVILDPNGSETLDGLTTRRLYPLDRVDITKATSEFKTVSGEYSFHATDLSISTNVTDSQAHNFGKFPYRVETFLKCTATDMGYSVSDEVRFSEDLHNIGSAGLTVAADIANIVSTFNVSSVGPFYVQNKSTRASGAIDKTKWVVVVRAYAR